VRLRGLPVTLAEYGARTETNRRFADRDLERLDRCFLPPGLTGFTDQTPLALTRFLEDDNRGAVSPSPVANLDGLDFYLSIKGIGSTTDPFALRPLDGASAAQLTDDPGVRGRIAHPACLRPTGEPDRVITGERWLRGSPYGGQGLAHARIALEVSERADLTSIAGFLIAPVVKIAFLPDDVAERIRTLHWYRRFAGAIVQEIRLVPSNVRIYFHARNTVGQDVRHVFDLFEVSSNERATRFELAFLRTTVAMLTLFARTMRYDPSHGRYFGLEYHDVWLDKDAVVAPDGAVYFVDLEGIEEEGVDREKVRERLEDQIYRSLYEMLFAYEQIDQERVRRFGLATSRKAQLRSLLERALANDPFVRVRTESGGVDLEIRNALADEGLYTTFSLVER